MAAHGALPLGFNRRHVILDAGFVLGLSPDVDTQESFDRPDPLRKSFLEGRHLFDEALLRSDLDNV
jgi:hypothetical protein